MKKILLALVIVFCLCLAFTSCEDVSEDEQREYTITYDANGGMVTSETQEVIYGEDVILAVPTYEGYEFVCWTLNGVAVIDGKWTIEENVTLVASWVKVDDNTHTVTFIQNGQENKVFAGIEEGAAFTDIPEVFQTAGYIVTWDPEDLAKLENVTENLVVNAIETVKTFKITFVVTGYGSPISTQLTVVYGQEYTLPIPENEENVFKSWTYNGTAVKLSGVWNIDSETESITLVTKWGNKNWTGNY